MPTRIFIHGLESSGNGRKGAFFKKNYPEMIVEDFSGDFDERMLKLNTILAKKDDLVIVGSSYGGLMATVFVYQNLNKIRKLILLAPALNYMHTEIYPSRSLDIPVYICHGTRDDTIPYCQVRDIADRIFSNLVWHIVDDDHFLSRTFFSLNWNVLLC